MNLKKYTLLYGIFSFLFSFGVFAQTISGVVESEDGPLPGATVQVKGSSIGTNTDFDGNFSIQANQGDVLIISFVGFNPLELTVNNQDTINVVLSISTELDEIVVIGYGSVSTREITGSVAVLSARNIMKIPVAAVENAIQGQMPGVQVTEVSGEPGVGAQIRVRGVGSISGGNEPLYVIDGFPISKNVAMGVTGDNFRRGTGRFRPPPPNPLANINPGDIESIQVLKDASAAAIYGSRGSNGVVIITTKKGSENGEPSFSYNTYVGTQSVANKLDLMNAKQHNDLATDSANNFWVINQGGNVSDPIAIRDSSNGRIPTTISNWDGTDTDWQDEIFNSAMVQNHHLSASGGSEKAKYYVSGNFFDQGGIIEKTDFKRYSLRANINVDVSDNFRFGVNIAPSYTDSDKQPAGSPYFARPPGIVYAAQVHYPSIKPYNDDGTPNQLDNMSYQRDALNRGTLTTTSSNPLAIIQGVDDNLTQNRTFGNIFAEYDIIEGLSFKTYFGVDVNNYKRNFYRNSSLLYRNASSGETFGQSSSSESLNWVAEQTLTYDKQLSDDHKINVLLGYTAQAERIDINTVVADNYPDDLVQTISGGQLASGTALQEEWSLASSLARVNYSFQDRFLLSASFRADTSSRFGEGNKTGYFPAASIGYRLSEDISASWLNDLKLRASYGQTGNFLIPNYASVGLLSPADYSFGGSLQSGLGARTLGNSNLSWEKTQSVNIGIDFSFVNNRVYGSAEYFEANTSAALLEVPLPSSLGFQSSLSNIGEIVNKGFEFIISSRNSVGALKWRTDFNLSTINNEVTSLGGDNAPINSRGGAGIRHITEVGQPVGSYYGYVTDGIYMNQAEVDAGPDDTVATGGTPLPGFRRFKDLNGDGKITTADRQAIGNYIPDFYYGINNEFEYKNFNLSFLIQGVEGNELLNLTKRHLGNFSGNFNHYAYGDDRWRSESDPGSGINPIAMRAGNQNNRPSDALVDDASYIRLRNVTLAYNFPQNMLGNSIKSLRVYASGTNLFTLTDYVGYNPEVNNQEDNLLVQGEDYGSYPLQSTFTLGININF